ncbi:MAG: Protein kinase protein [Acidobacteria bacterium]|nr:Protein kinase protein [Acidobacteriota bacterium]
MSFKAGDVIGDYEVVGPLGAGGMGEVYKVRNTLSDRLEAMKVLLPQSVGSAEQAERFLREIRLQAALDHPNIAALRTALRHGDQLVMIVELVEGTSLEALLEQRPLAVPEAVSYFAQALAALDYAHGKGVIHRDIKPGNILLARNGIVKLSDFGIARLARDRKLTATGATLGSIYYMSPEQVTGSSELHFLSDIYSLGITLYESVTGKRPFQDGGEYAILSAHVNQTPAPPKELNSAIPTELNQIILKAMAKQPSDRFPTAAAFREALLKVPGVSHNAALQHLSTGEVAPRETRVLPATATPRPEGSRSAAKGDLEMAYVLFMDLVGYSKLPMDLQSDRIQDLVEIVRNTAAYGRAHENNQIISLPTGDGMALVFFQNLVAPVQCAIEVSRVLKTRPELELRMGVHTGPVYRIADINTNRNVAGGGINLAQRVMDCGDSGHILLSKAVAEVLGQLSEWSGHLTDLGECEVKHGVKVHLVNFYTGEVGNPQLPGKIAQSKSVSVMQSPSSVAQPVAPRPAAPPPVAAALPVPAAVSSGSNRNLFVAGGVLAAVLVIGFAAMQLYNRGPAPATQPDVNSATMGSTAPAEPATPVAPATSAAPPPPPPSDPVAVSPPVTPPPSGPGGPGPAPAAVVPAPRPSVAVAAPRPAVAPASAPVANPAVASSPAPAAAPAPTPAAPPPPQPAPQAATPVAPAPQAARSADSALLQEQQERMVFLASRAAAVRNSFETMEEQQRRSGVGMRRDMAAAAIRLRYLLEQSSGALAAGDAAGAKRNLDLAERSLDQLERFLGR